MKDVEKFYNSAEGKTHDQVWVFWNQATALKEVTVASDAKKHMRAAGIPLRGVKRIRVLGLCLFHKHESKFGTAIL